MKWILSLARLINFICVGLSGNIKIDQMKIESNGTERNVNLSRDFYYRIFI